jgi:hypothetical protein
VVGAISRAAAGIRAAKKQGEQATAGGTFLWVCLAAGAEGRVSAAVAAARMGTLATAKLEPGPATAARVVCWAFRSKSDDGLMA